MTEFANQFMTTFNGIPYWPWIAAAITAFLASIACKIFLKVVFLRFRSLAERGKSVWPQVILELIDGLRGWVVFVFVYTILARSLSSHVFFGKLLTVFLVLAVSYQFVIWGLHLISSWKINFLNKRIKVEPSSAAALGLLYLSVQVVYLSIIVLIALSNLGVDITALIAGLGVGGIAVALAAQNILGDLIASLSIVLDKPFVIGDFITAGNEKGEVEHIGIKTTRLRSLSGEQLVLSNKDLLESRIQNFKRMWRRRVVKTFGVEYSTPSAVLEKIPTWVKEIIDQEHSQSFSRCHFMNYGASSLDFEFVFFVEDPDYNKYMDFQERVLLAIYKKFTAEGVRFAFPTQSLYIEKLPVEYNKQ